VTAAPLPAERRYRPPAKKRVSVFLEHLEKAYTITAAAAAAGVDRRRFYELRAADGDFAEQWADAYEAGTDVIREEIRRRGVDGWDEPVFQGGRAVGVVRKFSDALLMLEAKRRDPAYRDGARVEVTGRDGGPVELTAAGYDPPSLADVVRLAGDLGVLDQLGYQRADVIDGEALELEAGES
jgi:hypothetical protein